MKTWLRPSFIAFGLLTLIANSSLAAVYNSVVSPHGNWTSASSWAGAPTANTCSPSGNHTFNVVAGDSIWTTCSDMNFSGNVTINVQAGAVFYFAGNGAVTGSVTLNVQAGGKVIINGNLSLSGNSDIIVDGNLSVGGNVTGSGSYGFDCNGNSGSGSVSVGGSGCNFCTGGSSSQCTVLPVSLINFSAKYDTKSTILNWETGEELNNAYFEIEKSYDGFVFDKIGKVLGAGSSMTSRNYSFIDGNANYIGLNYYRLKQVDFNGASSYSSIITVNINVDGTIGMEIFPNPANGDDFNVTFNGAIGNVLLVLYDVHGNLLFSKTFTIEEGGLLTAKEMNTKLSSGIYYIHASNNGTLLNKKLMVR